MAEKRFERAYEQSGFTSQAEVWVDRKTGVNYLFISRGYGAGLTPLLNRDGKPVVSSISPTDDE